MKGGAGNREQGTGKREQGTGKGKSCHPEGAVGRASVPVRSDRGIPQGRLRPEPEGIPRFARDDRTASVPSPVLPFSRSPVLPFYRPTLWLAVSAVRDPFRF